MTTTNFPLYDGHGNVKASLVRSGVDGFATSGWKAYDVWGGLLQGTGFLGEHGYCGNLGHISDPSGAIYMRARYYEPWTGRFLSEDPAMDGHNWYAYCHSNPVGFTDFSGRKAQGPYLFFVGVGLLFTALALQGFKNINDKNFDPGPVGSSGLEWIPRLRLASDFALGIAVACFGLAASGIDGPITSDVLQALAFGMELYFLTAVFMKEIAKKVSHGVAGQAAYWTTAHGLVILGALVANAMDVVLP